MAPGACPRQGDVHATWPSSLSVRSTAPMPALEITDQTGGFPLVKPRCPRIRGLRAACIPIVELGDRTWPQHVAECAETAAAVSGRVTARTASRDSPISARSATKRRRSKFMLEPQATATSVLPQVDASRRTSSSRRWRRRQAPELTGSPCTSVFDRGANFVRADKHRVIYVLLAQAKRPLPTLFDGNGVRKRPTVGNDTLTACA